jgi:hypothetical protein
MQVSHGQVLLENHPQGKHNRHGVNVKFKDLHVLSNRRIYQTRKFACIMRGPDTCLALPNTNMHHHHAASPPPTYPLVQDLAGDCAIEISRCGALLHWGGCFERRLCHIVFACLRFGHQGSPGRVNEAIPLRQRLELIERCIIVLLRNRDRVQLRPSPCRN